MKFCSLCCRKSCVTRSGQQREKELDSLRYKPFKVTRTCRRVMDTYSSFFLSCSLLYFLPHHRQLCSSWIWDWVSSNRPTNALSSKLVPKREKKEEKKRSILKQLARTACGRTPVWLQAWDLLEPSEQNTSFTETSRLHFLLSPPPPHLQWVTRLLLLLI